MTCNKVKDGEEKEIGLTNSGKAIDPIWDGIGGEFDAGIIAEMVAVFADQIVCISSVFHSKLLHQNFHLRRAHISPSNQDRFSKCESLALPRFSFENSCAWILVSSECILHSVNCQFF